MAPNKNWEDLFEDIDDDPGELDDEGSSWEQDQQDALARAVRPDNTDPETGGQL